MAETIEILQAQNNDNESWFVSLKVLFEWCGILNRILVASQLATVCRWQALWARVCSMVTDLRRSWGEGWRWGGGERPAGESPPHSRNVSGCRGRRDVAAGLTNSANTHAAHRAEPSRDATEPLESRSKLPAPIDAVVIMRRHQHLPHTSSVTSTAEWRALRRSTEAVENIPDSGLSPLAGLLRHRRCLLWGPGWCGVISTCELLKMTRLGPLLLLSAALCCTDGYSHQPAVSVHRLPVSSGHETLSQRTQQAAGTVSFTESRPAPEQPAPQGDQPSVTRPARRRFEYRRSPGTLYVGRDAASPVGLPSRAEPRRSPLPMSVRPPTAVVPGSRRGRRYGSGRRAPGSLRSGASVVPGSRRGRFDWRTAPATLHARRGSVAPAAGRSLPSENTTGRRSPSGAVPRRRVPARSGRSRGATRSSQSLRPSSSSPRLPPLPPVYRNLCRQRRPDSSLTLLPTPLRSVCRDYWRRKDGRGAVQPAPLQTDPSPSAGEKYVGPAPLTARRRRHHAPPPALAAGPPQGTDDSRFYRPYWPYKRNGRRYY